MALALGLCLTGRSGRRLLCSVPHFFQHLWSELFARCGFSTSSAPLFSQRRTFALLPIFSIPAWYRNDSNFGEVHEEEETAPAAHPTERSRSNPRAEGKVPQEKVPLPPYQKALAPSGLVCRVRASTAHAVGGSQAACRQERIHSLYIASYIASRFTLTFLLQYSQSESYMQGMGAAGTRRPHFQARCSLPTQIASSVVGTGHCHSQHPQRLPRAGGPSAALHPHTTKIALVKASFFSGIL